MGEVFAVLMVLVTFAVIMAGFPVAFTLAGSALLFAGVGVLTETFNPHLFGALPSRIFGMAMTNEVLIAVPLFIFMGLALERSKIAEELMAALGRLFGRHRGGLGYAVFCVGVLLAASTGIVGATVVTMGLIALPAMLKSGYRAPLACGSIAAAGTLGQIIPPSIVLIILGDQLANGYAEAQRAQGNFAPEPLTVGDLFAGALIPGLVLVALYAAYFWLIVRLRPDSAPALRETLVSESGAPIGRALLAPVALIVGVLGSILAGIATPTEAASIGAVGALLLAADRLDDRFCLWRWDVLIAIPIILAGVTGQDMTRAGHGNPAIHSAFVGMTGLGAALLVRAVWQALSILVRRHSADDDERSVLADVADGTLKMTAMVFTIMIGASVFSLVFRGFGGDRLVEDAMTGLPGGHVGALLVVMAVIFVLGFFLDFIEITFVVIPIVAPILFGMGVDPVWFGIMVAVNLQTSFLTPPFGFALFYLRGVAPPSVTTGDIYRGVAPFVALQVLMLGILTAVPGLATWLPSLIYGTR